MKVGNTKAKTAYENLGQLCSPISSVRSRCFLAVSKNHKQCNAKITKIKIEIIFLLKDRNIGYNMFHFVEKYEMKLLSLEIEIEMILSLM